MLNPNSETERLIANSVKIIIQLDSDATVVLIGSALRNRMTWRSDIDLIAISDSLPSRVDSPPQIHFHIKTRSDFLTRLGQGDEFTSWSVRYGKVLVDASGWWNRIPTGQLVWPDWRQKLSQVAKRLRVAEAALIDGDRDAAEEELMMAASHIARAKLLKCGTFPLSRPELPEQLRETDDSGLALMLDNLIRGDNNFTSLKATYSSLRGINRSLRRAAFCEKAVNRATNRTGLHL